MSDPLVSIILRSFNEAWALRDTLPAIRAQEYTELGTDRLRFRLHRRFG